MNIKDRPLHLIRGEESERLACDYLVKQGLKPIEKNFSCKYGELDLLMYDQKTLVVVEVRFRQSNKYGGALESITHKKQSRIVATTQHYLLINKINSAVRFDVVTMSSATDLNWIKNAFQT